MQIILNGFIFGLSIALLAIAFQLVYLPTRVFFMGLAGLYALAPYACMVSQQLFGLWPVSLMISVALVSGLSVLFEWANHAPLRRKGVSDGAHLISSLGLYIILVQVVVMIWGNDPKTLRIGLDSAFHLGDSVLTGSQLLILCVSTILLIIFLMILRATNLGLRLRALANNPVQFALYGYNIDVHRLLAFGLSGVFVTIASLLTAYDIGFTPYTGLSATLLAVVAVIIGGRNSFVGPIAGALILGMIRAQVVWHFSARWQDAVTFIVLVLFLLIRPEGLFGQKTRIEANVL